MRVGSSARALGAAQSLAYAGPFVNPEPQRFPLETTVQRVLRAISRLA